MIIVSSTQKSAAVVDVPGLVGSLEGPVDRLVTVAREIIADLGGLDANSEKARALGWLDKDGICAFPDDVQATCLGYKASAGIQAHNLTAAKLIEAIHLGWIKFADGNSRYWTFDEYVAKYPNYPDPIWQLEQQERWPPQEGPAVFHI